MIRKPVLRRHSGSFLRPKFAFGFRVISVAVVVRDPDLIARQFHSAPVSIVGWPWCSVQTVQRSELVCRLSCAVGRDSHTRHIHSATLRASLSGTFLQTARFRYATEGALFISAQLSSDAVSDLRKVLVLNMTVEATKQARKHETHPPRVKKRVLSRFKRLWFYLCWCKLCWWL